MDRPCAEGMRFAVDGQTVLETPISPRGPLGLVLWVDNQFAAFRPDGRLAFGTLASEGPAFLEIASPSIAMLGT